MDEEAGFVAMGNLPSINEQFVVEESGGGEFSKSIIPRDNPRLWRGRFVPQVITRVEIASLSLLYHPIHSTTISGQFVRQSTAGRVA